MAVCTGYVPLISGGGGSSAYESPCDLIKDLDSPIRHADDRLRYARMTPSIYPVLEAVEDSRAPTFDRFTRVVEWPMAILALAVVPALVLENRSTTPEIAAAAVVVNWIIWTGFCGEYLVKLVLAPSRAAYVRQAWFDFFIIVLSPPFLVPDSLQAIRTLRAARVLRLIRLLRAFAVAGMGLRLLRGLLRHHSFHYVLTVALAVVGLGAIAIYVLEGGSNAAVGSIGDALWWAVVTATTVGYGDVSPVTPEGRLIAVVLMITGIGVIGVFTATVASFFFEQAPGTDTAPLEARLANVEEKLDRILRRLGEGTPDNDMRRR
ncbi:MAG: potassium channel family protein [Acidobacteria bacterium]|nr:potassium channel family protein [Acidobacteriota bacterium]